MININDIVIYFRTKERLLEAIKKAGREEMVKRICWLKDEPDSKLVDSLFTKFLKDDWVDDKGTPLGNYFNEGDD